MLAVSYCLCIICEVYDLLIEEVFSWGCGVSILELVLTGGHQQKGLGGRWTVELPVAFGEYPF
jgi:hypothetical protein